jgi:hypothetical protein
LGPSGLFDYFVNGGKIPEKPQLQIRRKKTSGLSIFLTEKVNKAENIAEDG